MTARVGVSDPRYCDRRSSGSLYFSTSERNTDGTEVGGRRKTNRANNEYVSIRLCHLLLSVDFRQFRIETGRTPRLGLPPSLSMSQKRPQIDSVPFKLYWELSPPSMPSTEFTYHPMLKINS